MQAILGGANRIYHAPPDDFSNPEGAEGTVWGRGVLLPTTTPWRIERNPSLPRAVNFLVRFEFPILSRADYDPTISAEAAHVEAFALLQGFAPVLRADGMALKYMLMAEAVYRYSDPTDLFPDNDRGLWLSSAEYRCMISNRV